MKKEEEKANLLQPENEPATEKKRKQGASYLYTNFPFQKKEEKSSYSQCFLGEHFFSEKKASSFESWNPKQFGFSL